MTSEERFWSKVQKSGPNDCWIFTGRGRADGDYGLIKVSGRRVGAHRFSWEIANGRKVPSNKIVRHTCDNPPCVNPAHLELGTRKQNAADMVARGRNFIACGTSNGNAKLTEEEVLEIRRLRNDGWSIPKLAAKFNLTTTPVWRIVNRYSWKNI